MDNILYAQGLADQIMRNNPLVNAVVSRGLMKWYGNYQNPDGSPVNFLWIGEFLPSDPNLGNRPQKGFSLVRDDSTHSSAINLYDKSPGTPLKQTLTLGSADGQPMMDESRNQGGWSFPRVFFPVNGASYNLPANQLRLPRYSVGPGVWHGSSDRRAGVGHHRCRCLGHIHAACG
jgi:hypothetical protein